MSVLKLVTLVLVRAARPSPRFVLAVAAFVAPVPPFSTGIIEFVDVVDMPKAARKSLVVALVRAARTKPRFVLAIPTLVVPVPPLVIGTTGLVT